jgi:hypothetical protein
VRLHEGLDEALAGLAYAVDARQLALHVVLEHGGRYPGSLEGLGSPVATVGNGKDDVLGVERFEAVGVADGVAELDAILLAGIAHFPIAIDAMHHKRIVLQMRRYANLKSFKKFEMNKTKVANGGHALGLHGVGGDGLGKDEIAILLVLAVDSGTEKHSTALGFLLHHRWSVNLATVVGQKK